MQGRIFVGETTEKVGETVTVAGWVHRRRDHGKLIFFDLRDRTGLLQVVVRPDEIEGDDPNEVRDEWVVAVEGEVKKRPENLVNPDIKTGTVELAAARFTVLSRAATPPFTLNDEAAMADVREELRMQYRYLDLRRPQMLEHLRKRFEVISFIRAFLHGKDFLEVETPILSKSTPEGARDYVVPSRLHRGKFYALPQSPQQYKQLLMVAGVERYFQIARSFRDEDTRGDRQPEFTQLDLEMSFVTQEDVLQLTEELFTSLVHELFPQKRITQTPWPRLDYKDVMAEHQSDRPDLRADKDNSDELAFAWVVNFPLFEEEAENGHFAPSHHMFTAPHPDDRALLDTDPAKARSLQHDLVLNGNEVGGGSIRIHDAELQRKIFELIGFSREEQQEFAHLLEAFRYGVPPHGGIAPGLDRFLMVLLGQPNIREVIAFPKTGDGRDLMMDAPSAISEEQLKELGLEVVEEEGGENKESRSKN